MVEVSLQKEQVEGGEVRCGELSRPSACSPQQMHRGGEKFTPPVPRCTCVHMCARVCMAMHTRSEGQKVFLLKLNGADRSV